MKGEILKMNKLELETFSSFDPSLDFLDDIMTPEEVEAARQKTIEMYNNFTDDDWKAMGDNY